jgi:hypothetical protein
MHALLMKLVTPFLPPMNVEKVQAQDSFAFPATSPTWS